jgi:hypothetical protein
MQAAVAKRRRWSASSRSRARSAVSSGRRGPGRSRFGYFWPITVRRSITYKCPNPRFLTRIVLTKLAQSAFRAAESPGCRATWGIGAAMVGGELERLQGFGCMVRFGAGVGPDIKREQWEPLYMTALSTFDVLANSVIGIERFGRRSTFGELYAKCRSSVCGTIFAYEGVGSY